MKAQDYTNLLREVRGQEPHLVKDVAVYERIRDRFIEERAPMAALRDEKRSEIIPADSDVFHTPEERDASKAAQIEMDMLETGNWMLGFSDPRIERFVGWIGLDLFDQTIAELTAIIDRERAARAKFGPTGTAPYRYKGVFGPNAAGQMVVPLPAARFDGRVLEIGEIVTLTRMQAEAWADRFEPVTEEVVAS